MIDNIFDTAIADTDAADGRLLTRLHGRLERDAAHHGVLDIGYRTLDTPAGTLLLAATDRGVVRVVFDRQGHDAALADLAERISPRILRAPGRLDETARQLDEYFAGRRTEFDLPLDLRLAHGFRRSVVEHLRGIRYGTRESYAAVAAAVGSPKAVRAAGTACAHNPLPVLIPCHRVVRSDGTLGQYAGGTPAKAMLLGLEGE
ncbi:methylated-DNA--[protein]-cysteine S-methyltransferase [Mycolicibacterium palauense]|uniref:methylated-DNA--[protein]-cysteine S-methyltransferase n=1 Tax=Mycolicibacterium palauense TaxID=2034511 RepID=UPI000BFEFB73|nr:methylated-DNA--[protein]-cysteine S-methyltransferase [Mycolicibacterium palauense]